MQEAANEFRAAAAPWPCGHVHIVLHDSHAFPFNNIERVGCEGWGEGLKRELKTKGQADNDLSFRKCYAERVPRRGKDAVKKSIG